MLFRSLFFGEAKKSESPAAATERHRNVSTRQLQFTSKLSGRATRKRKRAFSGSEPKFPEPAARPSGASLRCAAKLRSDPKKPFVRAVTCSRSRSRICPLASNPCGCAEERREKRIRDRDCLRRSRVRAGPRLTRAPQVGVFGVRVQIR